MPNPMALRIAATGARTAASCSFTARCSPGATSSPPFPSGKCTQPSPRSNCVAEELLDRRGLRVVLRQQLVDPLLHQRLVAHVQSVDRAVADGQTSRPSVTRRVPSCPLVRCGTVRTRHVTLVTALVAVAALAVTSTPSSEAATKPSKRNAATLCASPPGTRTGAMQSTELVETSGLAWSRRDRDLLWAHNDSGDTARVFALGLDGRDRGTVVVDGAAAVDWEDIALQRGPGKQTNVIWAGDVGDNASGRAEIVVYRFSEPDPPGPGKTTHTIADMITLQYADRPHDAEAMIVDDRTGDLVIITKEPQPPAGVFVARAATLEPGAPVVLERAGDLTLAASPVPDLGVFAALATLVTGADATGHGRVGRGAQLRRRVAVRVAQGHIAHRGAQRTSVRGACALRSHPPAGRGDRAVPGRARLRHGERGRAGTDRGGRHAETLIAELITGRPSPRGRRAVSLRSRPRPTSFRRNRRRCRPRSPCSRPGCWRGAGPSPSNRPPSTRRPVQPGRRAGSRPSS